jgi:hypothetical protein
VHILEALSVPYVVAFGAPLAIFLTAAFVAVRKLYTMLFGSSVSAQQAVSEPFGV